MISVKKAEMGNQPKGRATRNRLTRLVVAVCAIWFLLSQSVALFQQEINAEVDILKQKLYEADTNDLSAKEESNETATVECTNENDGTIDRRFSTIKHLFTDLATSKDKQVKPMIIKNFIRRKGGRGLRKEDIVLATQLSTSKLRNLVTQLDYWNGPASVAIYISKLEDVDILYNFTQESEKFIDETSFHLVLEKTTKLDYPANILRNVAMEAIESDYFLALDVDLIPMPKDCHDELLSTYFNIKLVDKESRLFVLPAFSLFPKKGEEYATADMLPTSKEMAVTMVKRREMNQFWKRLFPQGHGSSRYKLWMSNVKNKTKHFYKIGPTQERSLLYEPYVVGFKPGIPRYWEGKTILCIIVVLARPILVFFFLLISWFHSDFRGFGFNKISFFHECYMLGYRYAVLNNFYAVHLDHPAVPGKTRDKMNQINYGIFQKMQEQYLWKRYGTQGMPAMREQLGKDSSREPTNTTSLPNEVSEYEKSMNLVPLVAASDD